ncbi:hypothetical protein DFH09DRAFT_1136191 [Mycena vulgaris]|nr:hypothetical protein DFH09DRAFT_1136191 [Mycena vulgaris]
MSEAMQCQTAPCLSRLSSDIVSLVLMLRPTGLLSLPSELLLAIFEDPSFPTDTLYALSLLSRRLHFVALPVSFARHGITSATPNSVVITMQRESGGRDLVSALQMALFNLQIERVTCVFPRPHPPPHPSCASMVTHLRRLERLIARLPSVRDLTIRLDGVGSTCRSVVPRASKEGQMYVIPSSIPRAAHLTSLDIPSAILTLPTGIYWTLAALPTCRNLSLTFCDIAGEPSPWTTLLPLIASAASKLATLVLQRAELLLNGDILTFLAHLPLLTDVTIASSNTARLQPSESTPILEFRHLEHLRAPPNFVQHFLRHPGCLPQIKSVCISWPANPMSNDTSVLCALISAIVQTLDARALVPELSLALDTMLYRCTSPAQTLNAALRTPLARIRALKIRVLPSVLTDLSEIGGWVALFGGVRRVDLNVDRGPKLEELGADMARAVRRVERTEFLDRIWVNGEVYGLEG